MTNFNYDLIPPELKELKQWVVYKLIDNKKPNGKLDKVPHKIDGSPASSTELRTWTDFATAKKFAEARHFDGIGFVFTKQDQYCGIDLDHSFKDNKIEAWAQKWINCFGSYTEYSPSHEGVHIIVKGALPGTGRKKGNFECYDSGRFFTFTGNIVNESLNTIKESNGNLQQFISEVFGEEKKDVNVETQDSGSTSLLSDLEILEKASTADNADKFNKLFAGDFGDYPSQSEADIALCSIVAFWAQNDVAAIDRLFRLSKLYRKKWDEKHGVQTYGQMTVGRVIKENKNIYRSEKQPLHLYAYTDMGNAERFVSLYRENVKYCQPWHAWCVYKKTHWAIDDTMTVMKYAKCTVRKMYKEAEKIENDKQRIGFIDFARRNEAASRIDAMIDLARAEEGIPILPDEFDKDPYLFNCLNGTLDLRTGKLREHRRDDYISKLASVEYDPEAQCPQWEAFLDKIMNKKKELIDFLQRLAGYCLTAKVGEHKMFFLYGEGRNGKTTFLNTLLGITGDYGKQASHDVVLLKDGNHTTGLTDLKGARLAVVTELREGARLAEGIVKILSGGDKITARRMRQDNMTFEPTHKICLAANHKPIIKDTTEGMWRKLDLIPFIVRIEQKEKINDYHEKMLTEERSGILNWAIQGCEIWQKEGLSEPAEVIAATSEYRTDMDDLKDFIDEYCNIGLQEEVTSKELYNAYKFWMAEARERPLTQRQFAERMKEKGFLGGKDVWVGQERGWQGLNLKIDCKYMQDKRKEDLYDSTHRS